MSMLSDGTFFVQKFVKFFYKVLTKFFKNIIIISKILIS